METFFVATVLLIAGAIRAFGDFDTANPMTWLYLAGLLGTAGALALLHRRMEHASALTATVARGNSSGNQASASRGNSAQFELL